VTIAPNDPLIRYTGRVQVDSSAALYDWADTRIEFVVQAPQLELLFNDGKNDYNVFVDGQLSKIISTTNGTTAYPITLGAGEHRVLVTKRTSPNFGSGRFLGVRLPQGGQLKELGPRPSRKIEFIGDSYTVGYGNEGPALDCRGVYRPYENSYLSFATIAARALSAESHSIAISGFGAVRNYGDSNTTSATPMPFYYGRTVMERSDLNWNFQSWKPDLVVIKLGTNDHSTEPQPSADVFIRGIHGLITQVNNAYGYLPIILLADSSLPQLVSRMQTAMQQQRNMGNDQVHFVQVTHPPQSQLGCDWHPLVVGHQSMATELVSSIKQILNW
jgi:lysophospholipase L1-like esterase